MTLNAAAVIIPIAMILGFHTARWTRARRDVAAAKAGVKTAKKTLGVERVPFLIIAAIAVLITWWWLHRHGG